MLGGVETEVGWDKWGLQGRYGEYSMSSRFMVVAWWEYDIGWCVLIYIVCRGYNE